VRKLKDGDGNYLWQMGNYQAGIPQNLLGYNVVVNQAMKNVGSGAESKVMLFGDMSKFYVRKVGAPSLYVARERFAPDFGILGYIRFDGVLTNTAAIKHLALAEAA
jgi:HK97 family phage major capsid protein